MMASWDSLMLTWVTCGICITSDVILISLFSFTFTVSVLQKGSAWAQERWHLKLQHGSAEDSVRSLSCRKSERQQQSDLRGVLCHQVLTVSQCSCDGAKQTTGQRWQTDDYLLLRIFCVTKQTVGSADVDRASGREQLLQVGVHWCACWRLWRPAQGILTTSRSLNTNISPLEDFTAWWKQIQDGHILAHQHSTWTMSNWASYRWVARCHLLNAFS